MTGSADGEPADRVDGRPLPPDRTSAPERSMFAGVGEMCVAATRLTGADGAAITLFTGSTGARELLHATDAVAQQIDDMQFTLGQGPCTEVITGARGPQSSTDVSDAEFTRRWPVFAAELRALPVAALFTFPVAVRAQPMGALTLYRRSPGPLDREATRSAELCARGVAATIARNWDAVSASRRIDPDRASDSPVPLGDSETRETGDYSRAHIYLASGMVAVQLAVSTSEAMSRLRAYADRHDRSVADVAEQVVNRRLTMRDDESDESGPAVDV